MNRSAWDVQLDECYGRVVRGLIGVAGSRELGEDAFQDAVAAALAPGVIERIERADAWLYAVGLRKLRKARWKRRLESPLRYLRSGGAGPTTDRIEAAELLKDLAPRQREVVIARFYLDLPYSEISRSLGITASSARATLSQALARLRVRNRGGTSWNSSSS